MRGPIVLAGQLGKEGLTIANLRAEPTKPRTVPEYKSEPVAVPQLASDGALPVRISGQALFEVLRTRVRDVPLSPLFSVFDERYAVYWKVEGA
jgi:hypothetical protein